jgi:hypothetical protein
MVYGSVPGNDVAHRVCGCLSSSRHACLCGIRLVCVLRDQRWGIYPVEVCLRVGAVTTSLSYLAVGHDWHDRE